MLKSSALSYDQENQVMALTEKGIAAEYLSSTQTSDVKNKVNSIIRLLICRFA